MNLDFDKDKRFLFFNYNPRYKSLFLLLLRNEEYISSEDLAKVLDVSVRTIKNDIKLIRGELPEEIYILSKPSQGYILCIENSELEISLKNYFQIYQTKTITTEFETRVLYILRIFMSKNRYVLMSEIQEGLNVNTSNPLSEEMKHVRNQISDYGLSLEVRPHYGMIVRGPAFNKMMLRIRLFKLFHKGASHAFDINEYSEYFEVSKYEKEKIRQNAVEVLTKTRIVFSDIYLERFIIMIIYLKNITKSERSEIKVHIENFDYESTDEFQMILDLNKKLTKELYTYKFDENTAKVLTYVSIMSTDLYRYQDCSEENYGTIVMYARKLRSEILNYLSKSFGVNLYQDDVLYKDVLKILIPISLKVLLEISDDVDLGYFDWEMTKSNPLVYHFINKLDEEIIHFKKYNLSIREKHLFFRTIQGFINRISLPVKKLKLAIISIDARLSTQQLKFNLRRHYSDRIDYIDTKMLYELNSKIDHDYDYYLTTSYGKNLNIEYTPIYYANENLSESEYVESLHHIFYDSYNYRKILPRAKTKSFNSFSKFTNNFKKKKDQYKNSLFIEFGENDEIRLLLDLHAKDEIFEIHYYTDLFESEKKYNKYLIIINVSINDDLIKLKMISKVISSFSKNLNENNLLKLQES